MQSICMCRSGCINLVSLWNKDIESQYEDQINEQKKHYSQRLDFAVIIRYWPATVNYTH